jgi:CHAT domain-containing protein
VALGQVAPALLALEEGRGQALQQLFLERQITPHAQDAALWARYRSAVANRDRAESRVAEAGTVAARAQLAPDGDHASRSGPATPETPRSAAEEARKAFQNTQSAYVRARVQADQLWTEIRQSAPRAFAPPPSLEEARQALPAGTLFLAFCVADQESYLFLLGSEDLGKRSLAVYPLATPAAQLTMQVRAFQQAVMDPRSNPAVCGAVGRALFARLFPPPAWNQIQRARRLVIAPDGPLWEVPFAALATNASGPPGYLGAKQAISYTASLALFTQSRHDRRRLPRAGTALALVVGDPAFSRTPMQLASAAMGRGLDRGERGVLTLDGRPPARLPATRAEAEAIARFYRSSPLLGNRATEAAVRARIEQAAVIHFATHGFLHPLRPMSSGVLLTAPERAAASEAANDDGALQAWEIYSQLKLRAELVVLSACETGRGENVRGEGIVGLTRALQYAGAQSIVASQWKVADESTRRLMVAFHQKLRAGLAKDEALRQAMAAVRSTPKTAHPYYWAAFFLTGDPDNPNLGTVRHPRAPR